MFLLNQRQFPYSSLAGLEPDSIDIELTETEGNHANSKRRRQLLPIALCGLVCLALGFLGGEFLRDSGLIVRLTQPPMSGCKDPPIRREWRSLSQTEKYGYVSAVRCLLNHPSKVKAAGSLYEDFPYIHTQYSNFTHGTAAFLPWHRYMLHIYETELRNTCGYSGNLVYWDWSLDWESLANSPVFSSTTGFGGDGDPDSPASVGSHCVTDGPFANLMLLLPNSSDHVQCLSRWFFDGKSDGQLPGDKLQPAAIEGVLQQPDYEGFFTQLEKGPHDQIHNGIGGDFSRFTSLNDPLFILHHSQLDRLWWMWQQENPHLRLHDYGESNICNPKPWTPLEPVISMGGAIAPDVLVSDLMSTESELLCYRYL